MRKKRLVRTRHSLQTLLGFFTPIQQLEKMLRRKCDTNTRFNFITSEALSPTKVTPFKKNTTDDFYVT